MQCWVTVKVTCRKHPIFEWRGRGGGGGMDCFVPRSCRIWEQCLKKYFEVPSVAWATSLKKAVLQGQEFLPLPFSTLPHYLLSNSATSKLPMCYTPSPLPTLPLQLVSSSTTSKWPTGYLSPLPYTDRGTLRLSYPPYLTNWSLAPQPQNGWRATFLRSLTKTGGSLILSSPLYPTTCSQTSHH